MKTGFLLTSRLRLKLISIRQCLEDKRLQWFGHLEIVKENACSRRTFKVEPSKLLVVSPKDDLEK